MEALNTYKAEKTLAEQMNERLAELKMTKAEAALKMNYSRAALSQYLNGKYASDPTELEKKVREFLEASGGVDGGQEQEGGKAGAGILKKKVEFFESRDFVQTIGVCQACQEYMGLGIIVGKSGQGKTHALKKYAELPRVAYIECDDTMACRDLVEAIENGIGLPRGYGGTIWKRVNRIREFFNTNEGFLLIIDEADKLINKYTQKKMEILRGIFDQSDVGIVIAGEPRLETELKGNLARFANRMDFYYKLKGLSKNEVADYLEGYEVEEAAMGEMISRATNTERMLPPVGQDTQQRAPYPEAEGRDTDNHEDCERGIQYDDAVGRREHMKKLEVVIKGEHEEEMGREMLSGIYGVIQNYGYTDVSVRADTIADRGCIQIPEFLKPHVQSVKERRV